MISVIKELPDYIKSELDARGIKPIRVFQNGGNHYCVEFASPDGKGTMKFHWPHEGRSDPRAMKNNRSQLRHFLRRIYGEQGLSQRA